MNILFFGSTTDSVIVLNRLLKLPASNVQFQIVAIVTQPPKPIGREKIVTPTPVELWAKDHNISVLSFPTDLDKPTQYQNEQTVIDALAPFQADVLISASYGERIPTQTIKSAKFGGLNVHPSLLPRWRGADPVPWAILSGDQQTGATVVTLSEQFDEGKIIAQKKIALTETETTDELRAKLFALGADLLIEQLITFQGPTLKGVSQDPKKATYARRLTRGDGYIAWDFLQAVLKNEPTTGLPLPKLFQELPELSPTTHRPRSGRACNLSIHRAFRALTPWPGIWTLVRLPNTTNPTNTTNEKRLKILELSIINYQLTINLVQLEGKTPVSFEQFQEAYL